ncbi:hypothetical protein K1719_022747 [Acacia pycnantha]|nr:hypothetical protein K1719_022747 [Acacia pycnantha]
MDSIMKNLPIQDAVKTSILSRNWRYMWNSVPRLEFNATFFGERLKKHEISNAISEVLLQHHGPIHEFILFVPDVYPIRIKCLSMWILFLSRRNMKILKLINQQGDQYEMPSHLFSCKDLIRLELSNFTVRSPPDFVIGFKSLVQLHMSYVRIDSATLNALISSCPLLEGLAISYCAGFYYLNTSPDIKVLIMEDSGDFKSVCFEESKNLMHLKISLIRCVESIERGRKTNLVNMFSSLLKIKKLCLEKGYIQYLSAGSVPYKLPKMIYSLTHLKFSGISFSALREIDLLRCFLKSVPNLEELKVMILDHQPNLRRYLWLWFGFGDHSLPQLRTVTIEVYIIFEMALDLVECLLAVSPSLETLTFKIHQVEQPDPIKLLEVSRTLLQMRRASPKAEVKFI